MTFDVHRKSGLLFNTSASLPSASFPLDLPPHYPKGTKDSPKATYTFPFFDGHGQLIGVETNQRIVIFLRSPA